VKDVGCCRVRRSGDAVRDVEVACPAGADEAAGTANHSYAPEVIAAPTLVCLPVVVVFFVAQHNFLKGRDR
jgi:ABC-type glycerol-3-phosphate transport system permease component